MPRTLNPVANTLRRDAFVDVAQRLIQVKGYEEMSIQDVLDELDASKGAFYHYFDSKEALLSAVVERLTDAGIAAMRPVAEDPDLTAIEKVDRIFSTLADYKAARKEFLLALLDVWFSDGNTMVRDKFRRGMVDRLTPLFAGIVRQGRDEGTFVVDQPDDVARVLVSLMQGTNEQASELFLARQADRVSFDDVERSLTAYARAFERILGLRANTLTMLDRSTLLTWYG